ncbi:response regulator [Virgibacillus halophilus]|uniref:Response regulator n=1 Tax=Tigheibacillus halophilus TaxID=361280 RepID=A0ABU5C5Z9_9BACI|nr:response regulator [Virgibacillus halophilus]
MKASILIVDDEYGIRLLLEEVFKNAGYQVDSADTGPKALEKLLQTNVDLLLIDYKLPIQNGMEVIKEMAHSCPTIPVILMTGMVETVSTEEKSIKNIKHVLAKPFDIEDVLKKVEEILK